MTKANKIIIRLAVLSILVAIGIAIVQNSKSNKIRQSMQGDGNIQIIIDESGENKNVQGDYISGDKIVHIEEPKAEREHPRFSWKVSPLGEGDNAKHVRTITIRNDSDLAIPNFHFSIRCDKLIREASHHPFVEGGYFVINYERTTDNTYEAEVGVVNPHRAVIVALGADEPFEVENVKIYSR